MVAAFIVTSEAAPPIKATPTLPANKLLNCRVEHGPYNDCNSNDDCQHGSGVWSPVAHGFNNCVSMTKDPKSKKICCSTFTAS